MPNTEEDIAYDDVCTAILESEFFRSQGARSVEFLSTSSRWVSTIHSVSVSFRSGVKRRYWVKLAAGSANEFHFLRKTHEQFAKHPGLEIVKPVAHLKSVDGVVTEHVDGELLTSKIRRQRNRIKSLGYRDPSLSENLYSCGKWLAFLHSDRLGQDASFHISQLHKYINKRLMMLVDRGAFDAAFAKRISAFMEEQSVKVQHDDFIRVRTHGDFSPYNVLVSQTGLFVHDCDAGGYFAKLNNYCPRYDDLVRFHGFTANMSQPIVSKNAREEMVAAFIRGYNDHTDLQANPASAAFRLFELKYRVLGMFDVSSTTSRIIGQRGRVALFRLWLKQFV